MSAAGYTIRGITKKAEYHFQSSHIGLVWDYLVDNFKFNDKWWKKEFKEYLDRQPRNTQELDAFLNFGHRFINPLLNGILGRMEGTPTWFRLVDHVILKNSPQN